MDDPHAIASQDHATWQSEAEKQSDNHHPSWRRMVGFGAAAIVTAALIAAGIVWWLHARHFESTDDAFIDGYVTQLAPQVAGRVTQLQFVDNQHVAAGQLLVLIDPRDYQVKLDQAKAQRANAEATLQQAKAQVAVQQANLDQTRANVRVAEAENVQAQRDYERFTSIDPHAVSRQQVDNATAIFRSAQAKLDAARQAVSGGEAQLEAGRAQVALPRHRCSWRKPTSRRPRCSYPTAPSSHQWPVASAIAAVDVGNYVNPGQAMFAIVQDDHWVTANFKETQLAAMRPGQPVDINVDAVPSVTFHGHVDSFQPGTGSEFSVLPAENATGNYVKIVQRVPVKIAFDDDRLKDYLLAPGMSVVPYVRVR